MKIYYQYSKVNELTPTKGDFINEINNMKALSRFADVYYAGKLFNDGARLPTSDTPKTITVADADFVWVRANENVFMQALHHKKPCSWMASPYNINSFRYASFIACFSETWASNLRRGVGNHLNPLSIKWTNAVNVAQTLDDIFKPSAQSILSKKIRKNAGDSYIIGCFGRIVKSNYPHLLIACMPLLAKKYPGIKFLFGRTNEGLLPENLPGAIYTNFSHDFMPYALSACDMVFTGAVGIEWDFCGSLKLIEAAACGVPFICAQSNARAEFATYQYPGFLPMDTFRPPITTLKKRLFMSCVDNIFKSKETALWNKRLADNVHQKYAVEHQADRLQAIIHRHA